MTCMRLNVRQLPVSRLIQDSKTPLRIETRTFCTWFRVIPRPNVKRGVGWSAGPQKLISAIFHGRMSCITLNLRKCYFFRLIQYGKTPFNKKKRNFSTCFEVIPRQKGGRGVGWLAGPQKLISIIFHERMTCMRLNVRQWPVLRLIQDSKTLL